MGKVVLFSSLLQIHMDTSLCTLPEDKKLTLVYAFSRMPVRGILNCEIIWNRVCYCSLVPPQGVVTRFRRDKPETAVQCICCCERSEQ